MYDSNNNKKKFKSQYNPHHTKQLSKYVLFFFHLSSNNPHKIYIIFYKRYTTLIHFYIFTLSVYKNIEVLRRKKNDVQLTGKIIFIERYFDYNRKTFLHKQFQTTCKCESLFLKHFDRFSANIFNKKDNS